MLHTIVSLDEVFYQEPQNCETVPMENGYAMYSLKDGKKELTSFFSTNPYDYLGKIDLKDKNNVYRP